MNEEGSKSKFSKNNLGVFAFAIVVVAILVVVFFSGSPTGRTVDNDLGQDSIFESVVVSLDGEEPVLGNSDAEISIVEFSDFECPFCSKAFFGAIADFKSSSYFEGGEVNLIYKNFPLNSVHPYAQKAAEASECANEQGKFWEYHDILFSNQDALDVSSLKAYASQVDIGQEEFNSCLDSGEMESRVNDDLSSASKAGAKGTPYFVILNHDTGKTITISGAQSWSEFESAINAVQ